MDGTLLNGRVIYSLGERFGIIEKIKTIMNGTISPLEKSKILAKNLAGFKVDMILDTIKDIPLMTGVNRTIDKLKKKGHYIGIISDSYTIATSYLSETLNMDFHVANELEIQDGKVTGQIFMPLGWKKANCSCKRSVCKRYFLRKFADSMKIPISNCIAIGDSIGDWCMIEEAGRGIAFDPKDKNLDQYADIVINEKDLTRIFEWIN